MRHEVQFTELRYLFKLAYLSKLLVLMHCCLFCYHCLNIELLYVSSEKQHLSMLSPTWGNVDPWRTVKGCVHPSRATFHAWIPYKTSPTYEKIRRTNLFISYGRKERWCFLFGLSTMIASAYKNSCLLFKSS